ncbi:unnamed protein product, partial [Cuscuta epithymum]
MEEKKCWHSQREICHIFGIFQKKWKFVGNMTFFFNGRRWWCREAVPPPPVTGVKKCQKNYECHIFGKSQKDSSWQNENVGILIEKYAIFVEFKKKSGIFYTDRRWWFREVVQAVGNISIFFLIFFMEF